MTRVPFSPSAPSRSAHPRRFRPVPRLVGRVLAGIGAIGLLACTDSVGPRPEPGVYPVVGHVDFDASRIDAPEIPGTATAGVPFEIALSTVGGGCHDGGDTELAISGLSVVVTPYDTVTVYPNYVCTQPRKTFPHKAIMVFPDPGTAEIVLRYSTSVGDSPTAHNADGREVYTVEVAPAG